MLPYTAMGASQCIEDSACLSECLDRAEGVADKDKVLRAFEKIRRPRTDYLAKMDRVNARMTAGIPRYLSCLPNKWS